MKKLLKKFNVELYVASVVIYCILMAVINNCYPTNIVRALTTGSVIIYFFITFLIKVNRVIKREKNKFNYFKRGV